jgi:hypothetical protein
VRNAIRDQHSADPDYGHEVAPDDDRGALVYPDTQHFRMSSDNIGKVTLPFAHVRVLIDRGV